MGEVYRGLHLKVGRPVAIKVLAHTLALHDEIRARFEREGRLASAAGHPGIVEVFDAGELPDGRPYLVMELLTGKELSAVLAERRPPIDRVCRWLRDIALAVDAAHGQGVIHRDLKPENVYVLPDPSGRIELDRPGGSEPIKVLDFGIAHSGSSLAPKLTRPGLAMGTPEYMAPEQIRGEEPTPATDVYALGIMLYEVAVGRPPYEGETFDEIFEGKLFGELPDLQAARPDAPTELADLVRHCLAAEPAERPASAADLARRLEAIRTSLQPIAPAPEPASQTGSRRWQLGAVGLAVLLAFGWSLWSLDRAEAPASVRAGWAGLEHLQRPRLELVVGVPAWPLQLDLAPAGPVPPPQPEPSQGEPAPALPSVEPARPRAKPSTPAVDCGRTVERARDKRQIHDWSGLLELSRKRQCWTDKVERRRHEVRALMELQRFEACVKVGRGSTDSELVQMRELCQARLDRGR